VLSKSKCRQDLARMVEQLLQPNVGD
jgi:hypothetical protein